MSDAPWQPAVRGSARSGRTLAEQLGHYAGRSDVLVLALPRGGVPVAYEVARALAASLDVFLVRKLGVPGHEELAMGAIATGNVRWVNAEVVNILQIPPPVIEEVAAIEGRELARREREYRDDRPPPTVAGKTIILVDDGLATGSTMRAAVVALWQQGRPDRRRGTGRGPSGLRRVSRRGGRDRLRRDNGAFPCCRLLVRGLLAEPRMPRSATCYSGTYAGASGSTRLRLMASRSEGLSVSPRW